MEQEVENIPDEGKNNNSKKEYELIKTGLQPLQLARKTIKQFTTTEME